MEKKELRKQIKHILALMAPEEREARSAMLCSGLAREFVPREGMTVLSYLAMPYEADPSAYDGMLRKAGATVAYPVCGEGRSMEFYAADGSEDIKAGSYGIREPEPDPVKRVDPECADLVIVPCMGFDLEGDRLGHGGGYYDRYLPKCVNAVKVCIAFDEQELEDVPAGEFDVRPDYVVTPALIYCFKVI